MYGKQIQKTYNNNMSDLTVYEHPQFGVTYTQTDREIIHHQQFIIESQEKRFILMEKQLSDLDYHSRMLEEENTALKKGTTWSQGAGSKSLLP